MNLRHRFSLPILLAAVSLPTLGAALLSHRHRHPGTPRYLNDVAGVCFGASPPASASLFALYYAIAIVLLTLHFTGTLARHRLEWLIFALAATVFPSIYFF